jgi:hypothetical protein
MEQNMSDPHAKIIEDLFKINNIKTAILGGTFVGLDSGVGSLAYTTSGVVMDAQQYLNLYAELSELEKDQGNPFDDVGLSTLWNTGFSTTNEKITTPDFFSGNSTKYLKNRRIRTADQLFSRRSESSLAALFGCFKLKGKNKIIDWSGGSIDIEEFTRYALICSRWVSHPQTIYYVTSVKGDAKSRDYLYLIGGDTSFFFNPNDLMTVIFQTNKDIMATKEQLEFTTRASQIPNDIKTLATNLTAADKIWASECMHTKPANVVTHPFIELACDIRLLNRITHSVFNFYNYLLHAHKHLKLVNMYETDEETLGKPVRIDYLLKEYEPIYKYCKNLYFYNVV